MELSPAANAELGRCVASAGDVNGDGYDDVIVASHVRAYDYLGSQSGLEDDPVSTEYFFPGFFDDQVVSVAAAGDVDGDGFGDVLVGQSYFDTSTGRALLYAGSALGPEQDPAWSAVGALDVAQFGYSVASAGDFDGDGFSDVVIGAPFHESDSDLGSNEGWVFLYLGSALGLEASASWTAESNHDSAGMGISVAGIPDVSGDGLSDLLFGAYEYDSGPQDQGAAFVYTSCDAPGASYCTANTNSTGDRASISAWCSASSSEAELQLVVRPVPDQFGVFFHGAHQAQLSFGNGWLCITDQIVRGAPVLAAGQQASYRYDGSDARHDLSGWIGSTRHFQFWFRDAMGGGALFSTSDAVSIVIDP